MWSPGNFALAAFRQPLGAASADVACSGRAAPATRPVMAAANNIFLIIESLRLVVVNWLSPSKQMFNGSSAMWFRRSGSDKAAKSAFFGAGPGRFAHARLDAIVEPEERGTRGAPRIPFLMTVSPLGSLVGGLPMGAASFPERIAFLQALRCTALAAFQQPWQAYAEVEPTGAVAATRIRVATAARKTFLTISLLRFVLTQRYAMALGIIVSRLVNLLVPYAVRLTKVIPRGHIPARSIASKLRAGP